MSIRKCQCRCCRERDASRKKRELTRLSNLMERAEDAGLKFEPVPSPREAEPTQQAAQGRGEEKPYVLIETSEDGEEDRMVFATEAERDRATLECIWFGGPDESDKEEAEAYLAELREKGILRFEGDPPLRWETLAALTEEAQRKEGERDA